MEPNSPRSELRSYFGIALPKLIAVIAGFLVIIAILAPEALKVISGFIAVLAWPAVVLAFILSQRESLIRILGNLESVSFPGGFAAKIQRQVNKEVQEILKEDPNVPKGPTERQLQAAERVEQVAAQTDLSVIRLQTQEFAREYERIRATMPSSNERTRRMEVVATKMRTLALAGAPLLPELANSGSPGERLAAVVILQVNPRADYLKWLAERFVVEQPFIAYHAAVALRSAVQILDPSHHQALQEAIRTAKHTLGDAGSVTDRWTVLDSAERELAGKS
jgi:hypothetical protein